MKNHFNDHNIFEPTHRDNEPTFSFDWEIALVVGVAITVALSIVRIIF